ncbi:AI-2E family transporter [Parahaliea sp. F7430]|uniref:AI-2E family transporter n=2 Tax=Sediminihaliea albiluteola TaxID=2758564 RepID=A0A7W2TWT5_9GAMM|nr:AI-2E family transporter [Sediminihaliea albiluteola]
MPLNSSSADDLDDKPKAGQRSASQVVLYCLLALATLYTLYFAKTLLMPIVVALLFALLLSPLVALLKRFYIPRSVSAILLLACIGGPIAALGIGLAEPAEKWLQRLPELSKELTQEIDEFTGALAPKAEIQKKSGFWGFWKREEVLAESDESSGQGAVSEKLMQSSMELVVSMLGAAPMMAVQLLTFVILVLFQLIFGQRLYLSAIEIFPRVRDKQRASLLIARMQKELSRYILTVSLINLGLGVATAIVLWLLRVEDALLWGALVGVLNFAPYVGPLVAICVLSVAGLVQYGLVLAALVPAASYFAINMLEAQFITPLVLGHHMRLNPLVLVLWLIIWGWLWGAVGVLLAVPLLVCLKLAAQQLNVLEYWTRLIETRA